MTDSSRTLVRHFFDRFFEPDSMFSGGDPERRVVQFLALLAMPGLVLPVFFHATHPYTFVAYSMVVIGVVVAVKWESIFPDQRDYLVLAALPVSPGDVFAAKATALALFLSLFVLASNAFSFWIVPFVQAGEDPSLIELGQAFLAHGAGVFGGAAFVVLLTLTVEGLLVSALPPAAFRRVSPPAQMLMITALLAILLVTPLVQAGMRPLVDTNSPVLGWLPFAWFFGLYDWLLPGAPTFAVSGAWATRAVASLAFVLAACTGVYGVAYARHSRRVLESIGPVSNGPSRVRRWARALLHKTVLPDPRQRAAFDFIGKIGRRSGAHRTLAAIYYGIGIALALNALVEADGSGAFPFRISPDGSVEAPLILSFLIVLGLRATFNVPDALGANWTFQLTDGSTTGYLEATRRWVFLARILPLFAVIAPFEFLYFGPDAILHLSFDLVATALFVEVAFLGYRKVPYTCAQFPGKVQLSILAAAYLYGFTIAVRVVGFAKARAVEGPLPLGAAIGAAGIAFLGLAAFRRRGRKKAAELTFVETDPSYTMLDLS